MPVIVKTQGTGFLQKLGVADALIKQMVDADVKLVLGFKEFSFVNKENVPLTKGMLPVSSNLLVKDDCPTDAKQKAKQELEGAVQIALQSVQLTASAKGKAADTAQAAASAVADLIADKTPPVMPKKTWPPKGKISVEEAMQQMTGLTLKQTLEQKQLDKAKAVAKEQAALTMKQKEALLIEQMKAEKASKKNELWKKTGMVHLKDATEMYQQVHSTSAGSVYVVVALNDNVRIAARIKGGSLSLRVEGDFSEKVKKALAAQGIQMKGKVKDGAGAWEYASGHFECGNVPPDRVVGAILVASGLPFDSPIPDMKKVRDASK